VIGLDTNVLVRYYVGDETDEGSRRQRELARQLIESGKPLAVCKTVLLELEWVLRGYYKFAGADVALVLNHLLGQEHIRVEDRSVVGHAVQLHAAGLDFADALHHASYADCASMSTFDDRRFARRAKKLNLTPTVGVLR
jgi:predicted nucleic-acid-binding protein